MPDQDAERTLLAADEEVLQFLQDVDADNDGSQVIDGMEPVQSALARIALEQPQQALVRFGRVLKSLAARDEELALYRRNVVGEIDRERADVQARMAALDRIFVEQALFQRERANVKSLRVPTIGEWATRSVAGGWELPDDKTIIQAMPEADKVLYVERLTVEKVARDHFREGLEASVVTLTEEIMTDTPGLDVEAAASRARAEVAERFAIQWRDARVSVRGPWS